MFPAKLLVFCPTQSDESPAEARPDPIAVPLLDMDEFTPVWTTHMGSGQWFNQQKHGGDI